MNTKPRRRAPLFETLLLALPISACLLALAILALCGLGAGCAAPGEPPALPPGAFAFVTNSVQRALTAAEKAAERDARDTPPAAEGGGEAEPGDPESAPAPDSAAEPGSPEGVAPPPPELVFRYGGFDGSKAAESAGARIRDLRFSADGMSYAWAAGGCENLGAADRSDYSRTLACAFFQDDAGRWIGGKFDWISTSRTTRSWTNVRERYNGWDPDAFFAAKKHAFCIVSADGRRRTNLITD